MLLFLFFWEKITFSPQSDFFSWCIFRLVRFPFNPIHLLCTQQFHTFSRSSVNINRAKTSMHNNVWSYTEILPYRSSVVSITAFDLNLYGIKNREIEVFRSRNVNIKKVNINENAFISLKLLYLLHKLFNFLH